jgi:hypothetical protein
MQDCEETSSAKVTEHAPFEDRTRRSGAWQQHASAAATERCTVKATGHAGTRTVHHLGNILSATGRRRQDDRTHQMQRPIMSRNVLERRKCDQTRQVDSDRTQP